MAEPGGPDDKIIKEFDVYWCNKVQDNVEVIVSCTMSPSLVSLVLLQVVLLQSPLRPPHRPYNQNGYTSVKWKPKNKKVTAEWRLSQRNYSRQTCVSSHSWNWRHPLTATQLPTKKMGFLT